MRSEGKNEGIAVLDRDDTASVSHSRETVRHISNQVLRHTRITFDQFGAASREENEQLLRGKRELEMNPEKIGQWEGFIEWSQRAIESAKKVFASLERGVSRASDNGWISKESKDEWIARFRNPSVNYKQKEYWVQNQMPHYIKSWQEVAEKRDKIEKSAGLKDLVSYDSRFAVLGKKDEFLKLHFEKRKDLIAAAEAALLASNRMQLDLYAQARTKLGEASAAGILSSSKVGQWLQRIFKSKSEAKKVAAFIHGSGTNALPSLMRNWRNVRQRYDNVTKKFKSQGSEQLPRGIHLVSQSQFLDMHYQSRMHYVEEMERRLMHGSDLSKEPASFVRIRHAIDTKDWVEAAVLIEAAKKESLPEEGKQRLDSMRRYVKQFAGKKAESDELLGSAMRAKDKIDELLGQVPSSLQPTVMRLLRGPNANRSINQFRWIVYNNKWCRAHGYLNQERAIRGASEDNRQMTEYRAKHGEDVGRDDVISGKTADQQYFRKKEFANHKATYLHINLNSGAPGALAEWLEHERDPKVLYWTTFCGHEDGLPMSDNWHNDLFHVLTEMRGATRTIKNAGMMYRSPNQNLLAV